MARIFDTETEKPLGQPASDQVIEWKACHRFAEYKLISRIVLDDGTSRLVDYTVPFYTGVCEIRR